MRTYMPANFTAVDLTGAFWRERLETVLTRTIPSQYVKLQEYGILDSLTAPRPAPPLRIPRNNKNFTTQIFWDSDVGKWIEAASYALHHRRDAEIERRIDEIAETLAETQEPNGYLNCWYLSREPENRWTNLRDNHELYCAGHLLEGAIAYFQATGRRRLLDIMERYIDHIGEVFGHGEGQKRGYPGHQEIEIALIKLYHLTGDRRRLDLAAYFIDERGSSPHYFDLEARARGADPADYWAGTYEYGQAHKPVREQTKVVGHAVRAMYMYTAMADLAADLGDESLKRACEVLWQDVTRARMYITGGFGPSADNEGFTADYDLPNDTAYAETCASVAMIFWAQRMLNLDLDGAYADVLELALFNNTMSGLARDGEHYFYDNKLESDGSHSRWAWHPCPCCTMNASRLIASVSGYFYSTSADSIAIHIYGGTRAHLKIGDTPVTLVEESTYPWSGDISITMELEAALDFALKLRIPGWAEGATASVNGAPVDMAPNLHNGYLTIQREWQPGDRVALDLPMPVTRVYAHPSVGADAGRVCLKRGPLVYCVEHADNHDIALALARVPRDAKADAAVHAELFDGAVAITVDGALADGSEWDSSLYRDSPARLVPARLTAIPYYLWCNRGPGEMRVWLPET